MSSATGEMPASLPGLYSPEQKYSITVSAGNVLPWANPGGTQIHSRVLLVALDRHVVGDDLAVRRRSLTDVEDDVDHVTADGAHEFAHVRVPLKVQPANGPRAGETLVGLDEADTAHEGQCVAGFEIAESILFAEIPPVVREPRETNDFHLGNRQIEHVQDLHTPLPARQLTPGRIGCQDRRVLPALRELAMSPLACK